MRILVVTALLSIAALTACSADDDEPGAETPSKASSAEQSAACDLLSVDEAAELAGEPLDGPDEADVGGLTACQWRAGQVWVQAIAVPAETWVQQLPDLVDQLTASGMFDDEENMRKLEAGRDLIVAGEDLDSAQACGLFSTMLEIQGQAPGGRRIVTVIPTRDDPQAISAQSCAVGTYASVLLVGPDLTGSQAERARVEKALDLVTSRE